jgi:cell division protein ZapA
MPEIDVEVGRRLFKVACQDGEEPSVKAAASLLDVQAKTVIDQVGRMPSDRMLLLAGLILADRLMAAEGQAQELAEKVQAQHVALKQAEDRLSDRARRLAELQEVQARPSIPQDIVDIFEQITTQAEALANRFDPPATDQNRAD